MATSVADSLGVDRLTLVSIYRTMYLSRRIDDKEIQLKRQNKIFFQISGAGHEAVLVAAGMVLRPGHDWFYAYYRDRALMLQLGMTPLRDAARRRRAPRTTPTRAAGRCPRTGAIAGAERRHQVLAHRHAVPAGGRLRRGGAVPGEAGGRGGRRGRRDRLLLRRRGHDVARASSGRASTPPATSSCRCSTWSRTTATRSRCRSRCRPRAAASRSWCARSPTCSSARWTAATRWPAWPCCARRRPGAARAAGPALVHAHVIRPYSHSLSDDETLYRSPAEREADARARPARRASRAACSSEGVATEEELAALREEVDREVNAAADAALAAPAPEAGDAPRATSTRPTSTRPPTAFAHASRSPSGEPKTMVDLLNACLHDEMARDPRIVVFGEDVADCSREESLAAGQGQGRRLQGHPQPAAQVRLATASSTRRWPRPTSSAAPSAWPRAA